MQLHMFCVFDAKVGAYFPPMFMRSIPEAVRAFGLACHDSEHQFGKSPEDFTLFHVGTWDDGGCSFELLSALSPVARGNELVSRPTAQFSS